MDFDFAAMCQAIIDGSLKTFDFSWKRGYVVAPVVVSGGYPQSYKRGIPISISKDTFRKLGAKLFVAGAITDRRGARNPSPNATGLITSGGRVLACSAYGDSFEAARQKAYEAMACIDFEGMFYRKDIGLPGAAESD